MDWKNTFPGVAKAGVLKYRGGICHPMASGLDHCLAGTSDFKLDLIHFDEEAMKTVK